MARTGGGGGGEGICPRECESCRSAPGVPFCRVEWSFFCTGCAALAHANSWIVVVPPTPHPNPNPNPNPSPTPCAYPYPFPNPNPLPAAGVVQLSSDDDGAADGERRRRRSRRRRPASVPAEVPAPYERVASVMRYREKRKSRRFVKNVRYEARQAYAELRPRVDGKFARPEAAGDETTAAAAAGVEGQKSNGGEQLRPEASEEVGPPISGEFDPPEVELEAMGSREV